MTREEAIERLKQNKAAAEFYAGMVQNTNAIENELKDIEAIDMAIEALQGDMYCPNCGVRLVPEDEYLEPTQTHGRLIDADTLYASIAKDTYLLTDRINSRDYGMFLVGIKKKIDNAPTVHADRPHGEWICKGDYAECSECGGSSGTQFDGVEPIPRITAFCPHCRADMRKEKE